MMIEGDGPGSMGVMASSVCSGNFASIMPSTTFSRGLNDNRLGREGRKLSVVSRGLAPLLVRQSTEEL